LFSRWSKSRKELENNTCQLFRNKLYLCSSYKVFFLLFVYSSRWQWELKEIFLQFNRADKRLQFTSFQYEENFLCSFRFLWNKIERMKNAQKSPMLGVIKFYVHTQRDSFYAFSVLFFRASAFSISFVNKRNANM
jgi:hypothetical protein